MIWNTIAHPKMMHDYHGGAGDVDDSVVFSAEALESPIKHMNRDLLATFDLIIMELVHGQNGILKYIPILGNFETVYRAAKNKTAVNAMRFTKFVTTIEHDGKTVIVPEVLSEGEIKSTISLPSVVEGRVDMEPITGDPGMADFKNDRFVSCAIDGDRVVLSSDGEIYSIQDWVADILPKYKVTEGETEEGGNE